MNNGLKMLVLLAGFWCAKPCLGADVSEASEYEVKAAMVCNLTKYVDWPPTSFPASNSPIVLAILGLDNFGDEFKRVVEGKTINGRKLFLKRMTWGDDFKSSHLLFVSASERKRAQEIIEKLKDASVLTVGESDSFLQLGGMINLLKKDNKIVPEINLAPVQQAGLKIS